MRIHFIAIGGAIMHNLAIALHKKGHVVSGSDDVIFDPARSRLFKNGLLPDKVGWYPEKLNKEIDAVILGMHAKKDNPELKAANDLGIRVYSFPEFVYEETKNQKRLVVAGSHGKTTITSMVMHVLNKLNIDFNYVVGSSVDGFEDSVKLTKEAKIAVIEGDEYLTSPIDMRPKFIWYKPDVLLISGIAWDHINVFPTFDIYKHQFEQLIEGMEKGALCYYVGDAELHKMVNKQFKPNLFIKPYETPAYKISHNKTTVNHDDVYYPIALIGEHNLQNMEGARLMCEEVGVSASQFWEAIADFKGAGRRLELLYQSNNKVVYKDFAHSPSKVLASVKALKQQYADRKTIAILELHTFSSLNPDFLPEYANTLNDVDQAIVYINPNTLKQKGNLNFSQDEIRSFFQRDDIIYTNDKAVLDHLLRDELPKDAYALVFMSSGNYGDLDMKKYF